MALLSWFRHKAYEKRRFELTLEVRIGIISELHSI